MTDPRAPEGHLEPTEEAGRALLTRKLSGEVVMLNLLRFRGIADYSATPELAPESKISGKEAYQRYIARTRPLLVKAGGEVVFAGAGAHPLIGPAEERWDLVLLVRYPSVEAFMSFAADEDYLAGVGHRTAALEDSRLLPLVETASS